MGADVTGGPDEADKTVREAVLLLRGAALGPAQEAIMGSLLAAGVVNENGEITEVANALGAIDEAIYGAVEVLARLLGRRRIEAMFSAEMREFMDGPDPD